ncbi:MAG: WecB/TagA/CpsF family glycosyltransferase [Chloroflexota bacterium]
MTDVKGQRDDRLPVLGIGVDALTQPQVLARIEQAVDERQIVQIVTVNAEFIMRARRDRDFAQVLDRADIATADGAGVVWALRRKGAALPERVGGYGLIWSLSSLAATRGYRVFLLGGGQGIAAEAAERLRAAIPNLQIAGTLSGTPRLEDAADIVEAIRQSNADVLFVAFGAPAQDLWIAQHLAETGAVVAMGVGGSFDYIAGRAKRAPIWMQQHGLDWLWRLVHQPWRWRRMLVLPHFAWLVLTEGRVRKD